MGFKTSRRSGRRIGVATAQTKWRVWEPDRRRRIYVIAGGGSDRRLQIDGRDRSKRHRMGAEEASHPSDRPPIQTAIGRARCLLRAHPLCFRTRRVRRMEPTKRTAAMADGSGIDSGDSTMYVAFYIYNKTLFNT